MRYAETDAQRVVYHGNYVVWFEVGRTTYCERVGYPYARMEAEGIYITVVDVRARYRKSARYGDVVTIRTRCSEMKSRGCAFTYEVLLPDGSVAAEGETPPPVPRRRRPSPHDPARASPARSARSRALRSRARREGPRERPAPVSAAGGA